MSNTLTHERTNPGRFALAIAGLMLALVSPIFWALSLDSNLLHRTALMMWLAMSFGGSCAALAALRDRRKRTRLVAVITGCWMLFSVVGYSVFTRLPAPADVGALARAADFTLPDHLGQETTLSQLLRTQAVLLVFYRGHWWISCQAELRGLGAINDDLEAKGVKLVAVSVDPARRSREVVKRGGLPFPILADEQRTVTENFGLLHRGGGPDGADIPLPAHALVDSQRRVLWRYVSDRIQDRLSADRVLERVAAALANEPQ